MSEIVNYESPSTEVYKELIQNLEEKHGPDLSPIKKLGVALVGLGKYSTSQIAPALLETEYCYLAGIVTGTPSRLPEWKMKYNIPDNSIYDYDNFDTIRDNKEVDIVYINLPNFLHAEFVCRAAGAGKHVICEKPMALNVAECDQMIDACKKAGKLLSIGYRLHFDASHVEAMKIGTGKIYGDLRQIHAQHGSNEIEGWRFDKKISGGGALMDLGIYCIQAARYISGFEPLSVNVKSKMLQNDIEESITWDMEFPGGLTAICEASYKTNMNLLHADAEHGWLELSPAYSYKDISGKTATGFINAIAGNQQALMMDNFASSILQNKPVTLPGTMGRKDIKIISAIYESMETGNRIPID